MIVKIYDNNKLGWNIIDKVEELSYEQVSYEKARNYGFSFSCMASLDKIHKKDDDGPQEVFNLLFYKKASDNEWIKILCDTGLIYVMNDDGKTIDRF